MWRGDPQNWGGGAPEVEKRTRNTQSVSFSLTHAHYFYLCEDLHRHNAHDSNQYVASIWTHTYTSRDDFWNLKPT